MYRRVSDEDDVAIAVSPDPQRLQSPLQAAPPPSAGAPTWPPRPTPSQPNTQRHAGNERAPPIGTIKHNTHGSAVSHGGAVSLSLTGYSVANAALG